ncbi:NAD(P)-dependent alcohol dehydrogenase [Candidatus Thorarchaeota archaeon]|nr:MAG: NAD(P)-dependent alcohol dehydrogenase [Candidatus Thorarchaeota archaeon]
MRAVVVNKYGPPEGLEITELEKPLPDSKEVLIRNRATTVTFGDAMLRRMGRASRLVMGLFMGGLGKGKILGHEFAGEVEAIGDDVTLFRPGDQVFGSPGMKGGAHAEYLSIPEDSSITLKPDNVTFEEAASIPVGGNTALDILRRANIQEGQKVLIHGASGSVGVSALQLAKHWGAEVTAVSTNTELMKSLGADKTINYKKQNFTESNESYDVIFDTVRKLSSSDVRSVLKEGGVFLSTSTSTKEKPENLDFLKQLLQTGKFRPVIDRTYSLEEIVEAHRYVDTGRKKGNVVITIS